MKQFKQNQLNTLEMSKILGSRSVSVVQVEDVKTKIVDLNNGQIKIKAKQR